MRLHQRLREHATIIAYALVCGLAGAVFDQLTVSISPEYFTLGKEVQRDSLRWGAAAVGFRGGLPIGALSGGVFLWLRGKDRTLRAPPFFTRCGLFVVPATLLAVGAMLALDPFAVRADSAGLLSTDEAGRYLICWGLHVGAYLGPVAGVIASTAQAFLAGRGR